MLTAFEQTILYVLFQIEEDLTARINMADYKFSFHEKGKEYNPASIAPEGILPFTILAKACAQLCEILEPISIVLEFGLYLCL